MALSIDLSYAVIAASFTSLANVTVLLSRSYREVEWSVARRLNIPALFGMPIGLWVLVRVDDSILKVALGVVIIVLVLVLLQSRTAPRSRPGVDLVAGFASGVLATSTSTNGPPVVFAAQLRGLAPSVFRATLSFTFVVQGAISLVLFALAGEITRLPVQLALAGLPFVALGQWLGVRSRPAVHGVRFERLVYGLLILSAASVMWSGLS